MASDTYNKSGLSRTKIGRLAEAGLVNELVLRYARRPSRAIAGAATIQSLFVLYAGSGFRGKVMRRR